VRWSSAGELLETVTKFDPSEGRNKESIVYITDMAWFPLTPGKGQTSANTFVICGTDGYFYICTKGGKVEKAVEAHLGAVLCVRWNYEGTALVTGGEDGQIKVWSRGGMLRSCLSKTNFPVYSIVWSADGNQCLYTNGKNLIIKSLQPGNKPTQVFNSNVVVCSRWVDFEG
jgi:intraflagellar transport protein 80